MKECLVCCFPSRVKEIYVHTICRVGKKKRNQSCFTAMVLKKTLIRLEMLQSLREGEAGNPQQSDPGKIN